MILTIKKVKNKKFKIELKEHYRKTHLGQKLTLKKDQKQKLKLKIKKINYF